MTSLRLFDIDRAATAEHTTSRLFELRPRIARNGPRGWAYATSAGLHSLAIVAMVIFGRYLFDAPRPTPVHHNRMVAHTFVFRQFGAGRTGRPRALHANQHPATVAVAVASDVAPAPLPPARGDLRAPDPTSSVDEKPPQPAFDPPIPPGNAALRGRRGDPIEAGLGHGATNVRGLPEAEIKFGGLGDGNPRNVGTDAPTFTVRPGIDDGDGGVGGGGGGGGATPPRIQEPLPIPDYPPAARTRRLQGIVVLEVMLDALGKAHVRNVLSDPLGFGIEDAARTAAEKLRFTPARQGGRSVDAIVQVRVTFTLTGSATAVTGGA